MKLFCAIVITFSFWSCGLLPTAKKPFIIISKSIKDGYVLYTYEDARGRQATFEDTIIYLVGDTIK